MFVRCNKVSFHHVGAVHTGVVLSCLYGAFSMVCIGVMFILLCLCGLFMCHPVIWVFP